MKIFRCGIERARSAERRPDAFRKYGPISHKDNAWLAAHAEYSFALSLEKENKSLSLRAKAVKSR
jgi:hypothetical protein